MQELLTKIEDVKSYSSVKFQWQKSPTQDNYISYSRENYKTVIAIRNSTVVKSYLPVQVC